MHMYLEDDEAFDIMEQRHVDNATGSDPNQDLRMYMYLEDDEAFDVMEDDEVLDIKTKPRRKLKTLWNNAVRRLRSRV